MIMQAAQHAGFGVRAVGLDNVPTALRKPLFAKRFHKAPARVGKGVEGDNLNVFDEG